MILYTLKNHFYRICGLLLIGVALVIGFWGEFFNSIPAKEKLLEANGIVENYKEVNSGVEFRIINETNGYLYLNKYGNVDQLINLLSGSEAVNVSVLSSVANEKIQNVLSLTVNGEPLLTYEASEKSYLQWKSDMRYLVLIIALIGAVGVLFGDKLARLDKSLD